VAEGLRLEINHGLPVRECVTFQGLIDCYVNEEIEKGDLAHTSKEPDLNRINKHISPKWGMCLPGEVKPYPVQEWLRKLKGVSKRLRPPRILTEEEFGALLNQLVHPYRCMVLLAGCTGLRVSEVMGLRWSGINFESLVIEIREGYARSQVTKLKSECSQDELPLDPDVATILLEWKRLCPATEGDWVFPSPRTAKPYDSGSLRKKVLKAAELRAKIQGRIGWHTFRHRFEPQQQRPSPAGLLLILCDLEPTRAARRKCWLCASIPLKAPP
jgi:integrase